MIWEEINKILCQLKANNRSMDEDKVAFRKKMKDLNFRIKNATLKTTRHKLKEEKQELLNDFKSLIYSAFLCERNIQKGLSILYDKLDRIELEYYSR